MLCVVGAKMQIEITPKVERARKMYLLGCEQSRLGNIIFLLQLFVTLYISGELGSCCKSYKNRCCGEASGMNKIGC